MLVTRPRYAPNTRYFRAIRWLVCGCGFLRLARGSRVRTSTVEALYGVARGHHGVVGVVWVALSGYYQQDDLVAVDSEYLESVGRLMAVSAESCRSFVGREFPAKAFAPQRSSGNATAQQRDCSTMGPQPTSHGQRFVVQPCPSAGCDTRSLTH
jgi:hypothetical protein